VPSYSKPSLDLPGQLSKLKSRGLQVANDAEALHYLEHIGYYRLSAYALTFQDEASPGKPFRPNSSFQSILDLYRFDRELRLLSMDAIERIEIAVRSVFVNQISFLYGSHWFLSKAHFDSRYRHSELIYKIESELYIDHSSQAPWKQHQEVFINHYLAKYGAPYLPPIWMVCECLSFGTWSLMYANLLKKNDRKLVSDRFSIDEHLFQSWLRSLNQVRNICAHHGRLWNRKFVMKFQVLKQHQHLVSVDDRLYPFAIVCYHLLKQVAPNTDWNRKLVDLLARFPGVVISRMGFPVDWHKNAFWNIP
jgi:abortive infection bacteriophage resistance protein